MVNQFMDQAMDQSRTISGKHIGAFQMFLYVGHQDAARATGGHIVKEAQVPLRKAARPSLEDLGPNCDVNRRNTVNSGGSPYVVANDGPVYVDICLFENCLHGIDCRVMTKKVQREVCSPYLALLFNLEPRRLVMIPKSDDQLEGMRWGAIMQGAQKRKKRSMLRWLKVKFL